ncbi:hypothetical protein CTAM01_14646 [Colletotrichum tamarilloi]|uniref:Capsule polysaccharide biosynthesis protein n=1 Tax=Colletotrichum tamarilloi TaxID=1209934 RepID=A0ABQ9QNL8_9PEZI|nr:uncharacterized protein CTAM01_14646 [Colletotrichum tamarilloi]KAK1479653.1 hypothetical protein CTAM01_14646 [Colletotrichum tamarilloi]
MAGLWNDLVSCGQMALSLLSVRSFLIGLALANIKNWHFVWTIRFLRAFIRRLTDSAPPKHLSSRCLFLPAISATRSPLLECDYNMHKSNSTYFTDLDMSRGNISLVLFREPFNPFPGPKHFIMILGGAQCVWRKEIAPYEKYELWTRVLSWDEKWIYLVSHFVEADVFVPGEYAMQPGPREKKNKYGGIEAKDPQKAVFASSIARYVFKNGRRTVPPEQALSRCGLLPADEAKSAEVERLRLKWLPVAQLKSGWDSVHGLFEPGELALGRYTDLWWR